MTPHRTTTRTRTGLDQVAPPRHETAGQPRREASPHPRPTCPQRHSHDGNRDQPGPDRDSKDRTGLPNPHHVTPTTGTEPLGNQWEPLTGRDRAAPSPSVSLVSDVDARGGGRRRHRHLPRRPMTPVGRCVGVRRQCVGHTRKAVRRCVYAEMGPEDRMERPIGPAFGLVRAGAANAGQTSGRSLWRRDPLRGKRSQSFPQAPGRPIPGWRTPTGVRCALRDGRVLGLALARGLRRVGTCWRRSQPGRSRPGPCPARGGGAGG
jgi:hypothetical protein